MNARIRNWWPTIALIAYCAMLIDVIVFKAIPTIHIGHLRLKFSGTHTGPSNFIPFKTLAHQLIGQGNHLIAAVNILGNIGLFLPVGMLAPFVFRSMSWSRALALGMLTGLFCEALEVVFRVGIFDVDDVMLNAFGVLAGYGVSSMFKVPTQSSIG